MKILCFSLAVTLLAACGGGGASDGARDAATADPRCHATDQECQQCGAPPPEATVFCPPLPVQYNAAWCFNESCYICASGSRTTASWEKFFPECQLAVDAAVDAEIDPRCHATAQECTTCGAPPPQAQHFCPAGPFELNAAWCFYDRCYLCSGGSAARWGEIYTDCQLAGADAAVDAQP